MRDHDRRPAGIVEAGRLEPCDEVIAVAPAPAEWQHDAAGKIESLALRGGLADCACAQRHTGRKSACSLKKIAPIHVLS